VRVNNHQIEVISNHRKIRHSPSISFVKFSNAYEFEHVAKCGKLQCSSKHSRKLCERCRHLYTSILFLHRYHLKFRRQV
jgi:hypothetical protein